MGLDILLRRWYCGLDPSLKLCTWDIWWVEFPNIIWIKMAFWWGKQTFIFLNTMKSHSWWVNNRIVRMNIYANEAMSKQVDLFLPQQKSNMSNHAYNEALKPSEKSNFHYLICFRPNLKWAFISFVVTYCVVASSEP